MKCSNVFAFRGETTIRETSIYVVLQMSFGKLFFSLALSRHVEMCESAMQVIQFNSKICLSRSLHFPELRLIPVQQDLLVSWSKPHVHHQPLSLPGKPFNNYCVLPVTVRRQKFKQPLWIIDSHMSSVICWMKRHVYTRWGRVDTVPRLREAATHALAKSKVTEISLQASAPMKSMSCCSLCA